MPFTKSVGLSFNCGFCRGFVYEDASNSSKTSNVSKKGSDRDDQQSVPETEGKKSIPASDGENSQSEKVCLSAADRFRTLFGGPQLSARNFERYYETVKNAFWHGFCSVARKEEYVKVFSSAKWKALSPAEKSCHSVSNCVACSTQFAQLQKSFPLKPFYCPPEAENLNDASTALATSGIPFAELAANLGYKSPAQVSRIVNQTIKKSLYSKDSSRSPKQCLQLYNCTFMIHQLHWELFGQALTSSYFHALLIYCPVQHELVCSRSAKRRAESEERIFKGAEAAAKCTDRKPENVLPAVLKRLQCQRKSKTNNPLLSLLNANSRIAQSAEKLPPFKGTICTADFVKKRRYAYQAHLQRIGHFCCWAKVSGGIDLQMGVFSFMMHLMTLSSLMQVQYCYTSEMPTWRMF